MCLVLLPVVSHAQFVSPSLDDHLSARAEVSVKGGSDRSVLTTEFWAPLVQQSGRVVYTDLRLMGDDDDNREGNLGLGYRQVTDWSDSVLGGHVWIDRRRTEHNSTFHQVTVGVESLGKVIDLRANGYVPLNSANTVTTPNMGSSSPYLAGSGLFYDTNGSVSETPQYGLDAEAGYRLPILQRYTDTIRVYGGGYHFFRGGTDNTTGYRVRTEAVINPVLSVGARFQHDGERGSQTFLEATLRFPFSAKKLYQQKGLYARLDESPERDVDIVTSRKVDTGLRKQLLNTDGSAQRILYVDNSTTNGDGTIEHPFNNLTSAQQALQANDILYVKAGTGTTQGMDQGITISQNNVSLIGSGSNLTVQGLTFLNAGNAPVLTNTQTRLDPYLTGNGVTVTGANGFITGITVNGVTGNGIAAIADGAANNLGNITITNNTVLNGQGGLGARSDGVRIAALNGGQFDNVIISYNKTDFNAGTGFAATAYFNNSLINNVVMDHNTAYGNYGAGGNGADLEADTATINNISYTNNVVANNQQAGIFMRIINNSFIDTINFQNNSALNNGGSGITASSRTTSLINHMNVQNFTALNNGATGLVLFATGTGGQIAELTVDNITASNNSSSGLGINGTSGGVINTATISNIRTTNNTGSGFSVTGNNGAVGQLTALNIVSTNNTSSGISFISASGGSIGQATLTNSITTNNAVNGLFIQATGTNAVINNITTSNVTANNNASSGVQLQVISAGSINGANLSGVTANNNTQYGIYALLNSTGTALNNVGISSSNTIGNGINGLYLQKANPTGIYLVDLGSTGIGSLSNGQNRSFGNGSKDIQVNYPTTAGAVVFAQNNWWGNVSGLQASRYTVSTNSSINATPFLNFDPRP